MDNPLRIIALQAENVKRLRAVQILPDPNLVVIGGRNGQGKSSLLDSIWWALGGKSAQRDTPMPVRAGEVEASVTLDLGELVVERRWRGTDSTLTVRHRDGGRVTSPQAILDALTGEMAFDPLAFTRLTAKEQRDALLALVELPFDLYELEAQRLAVFEQRTDRNRQARALEARIDGLPAVDIPADAISVQDAVQAHRNVTRILAENRERRAAFHRATVKQEEAAERVEQARAALAVAEEAAATATRDLVRETQLFQALGPDPDVDAAEDRLRQAEHWAEMRNAGQRRIELQDEMADVMKEVLGCEEFLRDVDARKREGLAMASMPIDGLGFGEEGGITWNGLPFSQASQAEQLRAAVAISMAGDPRIRVVVIADGSLLDDDSMQLVESMAVANDFQVWIERVGDGDRSAIVIEDGVVASAPTVTP